MKLKDNSAQEIDTALYQLEQKLKSNIRLTDVENSNASTAKINAVDKKLTEEIKDRQSADEKLQANINKEIADRKDADAAIENAKQDKLIAGNNIQIDGNIISATPAEYTAEAPVKVTDGKISLDTVPIAKGGTGATTAENGFNTLANGVRDSSKPVDNEKMLLKPTQGTWYKTTCLDFWNYIKGKISSVLGLSGKKLTLQGETVSSNSYTDTNPKLEFKNVDGSQNISLTFTDFDAVQAPASLTLNGNQGNEYFIAPNIKVNRNITLDGDGGALLSTYGSEPLTIGFPSGTNGGVSLGFDRNSIQARTNGAASNMYINFYGGMVIINDQNKSNGGLKVKQKLVIPTGVPSPLEDGCIWIS